MYQFEDGEFVKYKLPSFSGIGVVRGVASAELPVMGCTYIVEDRSGNLPTNVYPYKYMAIPEHLLERQ